MPLIRWLRPRLTGIGYTQKINNFVIMIIISAIILYFIVHARRNPDMFLRKIGGLDAVDEALGRATKWGSLCCLFMDLRAWEVYQRLRQQVS